MQADAQGGHLFILLFSAGICYIIAKYITLSLWVRLLKDERHSVKNGFLVKLARKCMPHNKGDLFMLAFAVFEKWKIKKLQPMCPWWLLKELNWLNCHSPFTAVSASLGTDRHNTS